MPNPAPEIRLSARSSRRSRPSLLLLALGVLGAQGMLGSCTRADSARPDMASVTPSDLAASATDARPGAVASAKPAEAGGRAEADMADDGGAADAGETPRDITLADPFWTAEPGPPREPLVIGADEDPDAPFSKAWVERTYIQVIQALSVGAGVDMLHQVPVVVAGNKQALKRRREFARSMEDKEGLTYGMDVMADFLMGDQILGRYFPDEKAFYIFEENVLRERGHRDLEETREFIWAIMAHEMVHAYDDQVYESVPTIDVVLKDIGVGDRMGEINAMMTLLEGRATFVAELACEAADIKKLPVRSMEDVRNVQMMKSDGSVAQDVGAGVLNFVGRAKLAQYVSGREFAMRAYNMGGEKFFGEIFASLPLSMAEVEDFDRFFIRWAEEMEESEEASGP